MNRVLRRQVFETNSSAVHTLAIARDGLEQSNLSVDKDGYIVICFGSFPEWDMGITTFDQATKLSYIATECYYLNGGDKNIEEYYEWQCVCEAICKYTGAKGVRLLREIEPELNHQEQPYYNLHFCNAYDEDSVINFIFNKYVGIKMSHD